MYKYLILKCVFDTCFCIGNIMPAFDAFCFRCAFTLSLWFMIVKLVCLHYLTKASTMLTLLCELFAIFDRYRHLTNHFKCANKWWAFRICGPIIVFGVLLTYSFKFYFYQILAYPDNFLFGGYTIEITGVDYLTFVAIDIILPCINNFLLVVVICILNVVTLAELKKKKEVEFHITTPETSDTLMLIWTCPLVILPNLFYLPMTAIFGLLNYIHLNNVCVEVVGEILHSLPFSFSFVFYYFFNFNFRQAFHELFF